MELVLLFVVTVVFVVFLIDELLAALDELLVALDVLVATLDVLADIVLLAIYVWIEAVIFFNDVPPEEN